MANQSPTIGWQREVGINMVGAYQVSGRPYASASINADNAMKIEFPYVTRWVTVINKSTVEASASNSGYGTSPVLEMKISDLWLYSPAKVTDIDVVAGLTTIGPKRTTGSLGLNFSGSYVGV